MPIKIGVLVPNSNYIPFLARDIPHALALGLAENLGMNYELCIEPSGYNADKNVLVSKIQELLVKQQVNVVVAPLNAGLIEDLKPYFSGQQVPLIVNTLGEDVVNHTAQDPYVFINSFNLWQTSWLSGYWGAAEYGKTACSMAAFHDGGYGITFAFGLGLEAQAGKLVHVAVTHRESRVEDPSESIQMIATNHPDFMMGFYAGKETLSFLEAYHRLSYRDSIPLIGLPFMVDESLLDEVGELALGIKTLSCWRRNTREDQAFTQTFQAETGHPVNCYVLMAYETGHLISRAVQQIGINQSLNGKLPEALHAVEFQGPRGLIKFHPETKEVVTTNYLREVVRGEDGRFYNKVIREVDTPALFYEQLALARKNLAKQGWLNPYLVA
ncbi:ABC transporter substrate-binding protein [Synechococcales cyanobacterium C]|uniref:ABC transporter substrate-binding protein n=1 Tax=Petrachloros mirabilis ULC683 TaxID=2781853 RepID=A0A8K2A1N5_9CYAN|nr:ABC transporter substrate-binding protein [Petrachloros mirabilis]NCJ08051.1 ABC transporter substrate-binding protein [Petrachloros mirabilis ULC683]